MCDCFHLAFPNWHDTSTGTGAGRRLRGPDPGGPIDSICEEPSQYTEGERPRPQGSSPVEDYPETERFSDSEKEFETDQHNKKKEKKNRKSGFGYMFEKSSTSKMSKLKEAHSPESGVIVKTAKDGCAEGLIYGGGGKEGIFIKEVVPESPASKSLRLREGDQILSATVYFDNVPFEDAVQILEHAQAYNVKLCLKRKPEITLAETAVESGVFPEDGSYNFEMRDKEKTKRRGDARISWPKFPTLGRGRKSHFKRSHSSSEADEQRKLELSPTTSDTESPIKSQDVLKGKKRNKMKLTSLTKTGRVSSSDGQDTDAPTTRYEIEETREALPVPLESPSKEIQGGGIDLEDSRQVIHQSPDEVGLISIVGTVKSDDLPSPTKSPDGKKKKKENSQLKIRILGKDKTSKKDAQGEASPKRLKTLGASLDIPDRPKTEECVDAGSVEQDSGKDQTDLSSVALLDESPQKSKEKTKKKRSKDKTSPKFKLPKIGFIDYTTEQSHKTIKEDDQGYVEKQPCENKDKLYGRLSKDSFSRTQLPKREDIEIPGMEDASKKRTSVGINGNGETLQLSIDVDSVKEAVSKLPGYKLPQVDTDGVLIPEEIIVIDANAQRISVKTPTKVVDYNAKKGSKPDTVSGDATVDPSHKTKKQEGHDFKSRKAKKPLSGFGVPKLDLSFTDFSIIQKKNLSEKGESRVVHQEENEFNKDIKLSSNLERSPLTSHNRVETPIDGIEYIDSAGSPDKEDQGTALAMGIDVEADCVKAGVDRIIKLPKFREDFADIKAHAVTVDKVAIKTPDKQEKGSLLKMPTVSISMTKFTGSGVDLSKSSAILPESQIEVKTNQNIFTAEQKLEIEIKNQKNPNELDEQNSLFKKPILDITIPQSKVSGETEVERKVLKAENKEQSAELGIKSPDIKIEAKSVTDSPSKFRMPKFKLPKLEVGFREVETGVTIKGSDINAEAMAGVDVVTPNVDGTIQDENIKKSKHYGNESKVRIPDLSSSMQLTKDVEVKVQEDKIIDIEVELPKSPDLAIDVKDSAIKLDGHGTRFKMPKFGIKMPKMKTQDNDLSNTERDITVDVKIPEDELKKPSAEVETKISAEAIDDSTSKFKMPKFKMPKFGAGSPTVSAEVPIVDAEVICLNIAATEKDFNIASNEIDIDDSVTETQMESEDGKGSKFRMPNLGLSMPTVGKPKIDLSFSRNNADLHLPKADIEVEESIIIDASNELTNVEAEVKLPDVHEIAANCKPTDEQTDVRGGKFKMPTFGIRMPKVEVTEKDLDVTLAKTEAKIELPDFEQKDLNADGKIKSAEIIVAAKNADDSPKFKMPKFKLLRVGVGSPTASIEVSDVDADVQIKSSDINIPEDETVINIVTPNVKVDAPSVELKTTGSTEGGKGSKFRMPHLGISVPMVKGPKIDLKLSDGKADIEIPEIGETLGQAGILIPEQNVNIPEIDVEVKLPEDHHVDADGVQPDKEVDRQGGKFKLPKFGIKMPKVKAPEMDLNLSSKDTDVTLTEAGFEIPVADLEDTLVDVEIKSPEIVTNIKSSDDSTSKYKIKKFKLPKFGLSSAKASMGKSHAGAEPNETELDVDLNLTKKNINGVAPEINVKIPDLSKFDTDLGKVNVSIPAASGQKIDSEWKSGLKMPVLGIKMPKLKGTELDLSKKTDISVPGTKASVELTDVKPIGSIPTVGLETDVQEDIKTTIKDLEEPKVEIDLESKTLDTPELGTRDIQATVEIEGSRFKMPRFGFSKPKLKVHEIDLNINNTGIEVENKVEDMDATLTAEITIPEVKEAVNPPDAEIKVPEAKAFEIKAFETDNQMEHLNESPSKFKLPSFKFPKFGAAPKVKVDVRAPDLETDFPKVAPTLSRAKDENEDLEIQMHKAASTIETAKPEIDLNLLKFDEQPSLEVRGPVRGQELPSPNLEIKAPELNIKVQTAEASPSKFWLPSFKLPKFGFGGASSTAVPDKEHDVIIDSQEEVVEIVIEKVHPSMDITTKEVKENVDVTLPTVQANVEPLCIDHKESVKDEKMSSEIEVLTKDTKGYQSKFKIPTFKVPKFGISNPSATIEVPDVENSLQVDGHQVVSSAASALVDVETPRLELEGKNTNTENAKFGLSASKIKTPALDISVSKQDVGIAIHSVKADVQLPEDSAKVELKSPEMKAVAKTTKGSPSKFKMPTFKLPRLGIGSQQVALDTSDVQKGPIIDGNVDYVVECKPNIESAGLEQECEEIKVELPQVEIKSPDITASNNDVDDAFTQVMADVQLPDMKLQSPSKVELKSSEIKAELKGSPSKFKMPVFKIPKFGVGFSNETVETPEIDNDLKINNKEKAIEVGFEEPQSDILISVGLETSQPEHVKEIEIKQSKLGTSVPEVKGADIDLNVSNKEVDINLPAVGINVQLPEIDIKETHKVKITSPEKKAVTHDAKGSPSKFKMPSFTLPRFGIGTPSATIKPPDVDSRLIIDGDKEVGSVSIAAPHSDIGPANQVETTRPELEGKEMKIETKEVPLTEIELKDSSATVEIKPPEIKAVTKETKVSASKFKMPSFKLPKIGISTPSATAEEPEIDKNIKIQGNKEISIKTSDIYPQIGFETTKLDHEGKDIDLELPAMAIPAPQVKGCDLDIDPSKKGLMESMAKVEVKSPEIKAVLKEEKGSPSKFKMPTLKLLKIGIGSSSATTEVPVVDNGLKIDGKGETVGVSITLPSITVKSTKTDHEDKEIKMGPPTQLKGPEVDLKPLNITLPSIKSGIQLPDTGLNESSAKVEFETPVITKVTKEAKGSPSKFKMPSFKLPKFGSPSAAMEVNKGEGLADVVVEPTDAEHGRKEITVQMTNIDLSAPKVDGAEVDFNLLNTDVDVTLPKIEAEFHHEIKLPTLDISTDKAQDSSSDGTPATNLDDKIKKSRFSFPKFSFSKQTSKDFQVNVSQPTVDVSIAEGKVEVIQPPVEVKLVETNAEVEGKDNKFKMPKFGISLTKPKSSESDLDLSKIDDNVRLPKVEVQPVSANVEANVTERIIGQGGKETDAPAKGSEKEGTGSKFKIANFGFLVQGADKDSGLSKEDIEVQMPDVEANVQLLEDEMEQSNIPAAAQDKPDVEVDAKLKQSNWTFPKFSFSRSGGKPYDVSLETTTEDLSVSKTKVAESKSAEFSEIEETNKEYETVIRPPELCIGPPECEGDLPKHVTTIPEVDLDVKTSEVELSQPVTPSENKAIETATEVKDGGGSPFKFKLPSLKMSLFRAAANQTSTETSMTDKGSETKVEGAELEVNISVTESPVVEPKVDTFKRECVIITKSDDEPVSPVSPSKLQLPLHKIPLGFSRQQPEEEYISVERKDNPPEIKIESKSPKSPKLALASMGDMLQNLTVEFDVSIAETEEVHVDTTNKTLEKQVEVKVKQIETIQESPKKSEWGGWFKFPMFGLSSPSEQPKSPAKEKVDEEISPTSSVQSSDAFADISSTITSEPAGLSPSSPTKVTVKYTDPDEKIHSNITSSTKRTQTIAVEPMIAEKITNLSSGVSSSSEETLRLESGKIHLLTSNIQANPESHHTKLITYVHGQSEGGFIIEREAGEAEPQSTECRQTGKIGFEKHLIEKQSSESKETIVITKQVTRVFTSAAEPITHETASSIRQLKESVHSEKMRFFDRAKK